MKKSAFVISVFFALFVLVAAAPIFDYLQVNRDTGKVNRPDFWNENAPEINAVVVHPTPNKIVFVLIPPFNLNVTDFKLKARNAQGELVYYIISTDPRRQWLTDQIYETRPLVRFTSPFRSDDADKWHVQVNTPIYSITGGVPSGGFVVEIDASEIPDYEKWEWVCAFMNYDSFIERNGTPYYFPAVPIGKYEK